MLRIRSTDGRIGTTQPWRFFFLEGRGEIGWEYAGIATERSDGGNDCSLPYRFSFYRLEGVGSAGALEHYIPSKVSIRSAAEVADRSLPYSL